MKEIEQLMQDALPLPGLVGWGAQKPEGTYAGQCLADWLWPEQLEQLTRKVAAACATLPPHRLPTANTCWVYERARLFASLRPDQACLVLLVENRPGLGLTKVHDLLKSFAATTR
jgi:hypothetical protein